MHPYRQPRDELVHPPNQHRHRRRTVSWRFPQSQLGFEPQPAGGLVLFWNPDGSRVLDAVTYDAQGYGVSSGRWPDGGDEFYPMLQATPGAPNGQIRIDDIVINEIMYDPISGNDDDQYVELFNKGTNTVDLTGWQFVDGITFAIPAGTTIALRGIRGRRRQRDQPLRQVSEPELGEHGGGLSPATCLTRAGVWHWPAPITRWRWSAGCRRPTPCSSWQTKSLTRTGGRWGQWAHGGGSSLELINPNTNHRLAGNWADSDETRKSVLDEPDVHRAAGQRCELQWRLD